MLKNAYCEVLSMPTCPVQKDILTLTLAEFCEVSLGVFERSVLSSVALEAHYALHLHLVI